MTKLDLVLARLRKLSPERQEAIAAEIELVLDSDERGSVFNDKEWAAIEASMIEGDVLIRHEQVVAEMGAKFPG
jgi:hypothetical protein